MKIRFAVAPAPRDTDPAHFTAFVDGLEHLGFDTMWLSDIPVGSTFDPFVALGVAAGRTERLKLGANVVPFGHNRWCSRRRWLSSTACRAAACSSPSCRASGSRWNARRSGSTASTAATGWTR